jgi:hypothetical protein
MDKVQTPRNSEYYTPSSEPFRTNILVVNMEGGGSFGGPSINGKIILK